MKNQVKILNIISFICLIWITFCCVLMLSCSDLFINALGFGLAFWFIGGYIAIALMTWWDFFKNVVESWQETPKEPLIIHKDSSCDSQSDISKYMEWFMRGYSEGYDEGWDDCMKKLSLKMGDE